MMWHVKADSISDRLARTEAEDVCKSLVRYVKDNEKAIQASASRWKDIPAAMSDFKRNDFLWDQKGTLAINGEKLDHPSRAWFMFSPAQDSFLGGYSSTNIFGRPVFVFGFLKAAWDSTYLATRINDRTFTHEYIHHLDTLRQKGSQTNSVDKFRNKGSKAYFNDPHEFNAYYQEGLSTLHSLLERKGDSWLTDDMKRKLLRDTFAEFAKETFRQGFSEDFLHEIEPKYKRKLMKRLYGFWMDQKARVSVTGSLKLSRLKLGQSVIISDMVKNPNPEGLKEWVTEEHARRWSSEQGKVELNKYADISNEALDKAYGYGISKPGTFGYTANQKSAEYALDVIEQGETDIEKISDAIHQGWSEAAKSIDDPIYATKPAKKRLV